MGTLYRPVFDRLKIPGKSWPTSPIRVRPHLHPLPFNAWGAFIMGLLLTGHRDPFRTLVASMAFNFYPMIRLLLVLWVVVTRKDFGPIAQAERRTRETGLLMNEGRNHGVGRAHVP
ncbi:MAG: hypothetical protein R2751_19660 [Bacteroidales bacterium]